MNGVTNSARFAPLVAHAARRCDELSDQFAVTVDAEFPALPWVRTMPFARPPIRLVPADPSAAVIAVAFSTFPGVYVRAGHWHFEPFPRCGCDSCGGDADAEIVRFDRLIDAVTSGDFSEALETPWFGDAHVSYCIDSTGESSGSRIDRKHAKIVGKSLASSRVWQAWPRAHSH